MIISSAFRFASEQDSRSPIMKDDKHNIQFSAMEDHGGILNARPAHTVAAALFSYLDIGR